MTSHELPLGSVADLVARALHEDLAGGDLTTEACIDADAMARASAVARGAMVACGGAVFEQVFRAIDPSLVVERVAAEGERVGDGTTLWTVRGRARSILMGERVALNFVQRMIGIATMARSYVDALPEGSTTRITDIRKTTPGLRSSSATRSASAAPTTTATTSGLPSSSRTTTSPRAAASAPR